MLRDEGMTPSNFKQIVQYAIKPSAKTGPMAAKKHAATYAEQY